MCLRREKIKPLCTNYNNKTVFECRRHVSKVATCLSFDIGEFQRATILTDLHPLLTLQFHTGLKGNQQTFPPSTAERKTEDIKLILITSTAFFFTEISLNI